MTFAPRSISDLAAYWVSKGGVNLGIVGNQAHCSGYHLGRDRIYSNCACRRAGKCLPGLGASDYSVKIARDRKGLSDAASALDLGRLNGTLRGLREFSTWLVSRCMADAPGALMVREIIYSPDGKTVQRWSGEDNKIHTGPGNGDSSHLTHTHISFYRDTESDAKIGLFAPYFEAVTPPDSSTGDTVQTFKVPEQRTFVTLPRNTKLYDNSALAANAGTVILDPGREFVLIGYFSSAVDIIAYEPPQPDPGPNSKAMFVKASDVGATRVEKPRTQAEVDAAYNNGLDTAQAAVTKVPRR
jgi:hypothetical protein